MSTEANDTATDPTELLDVLACDITARPKGAPSFSDLQGAIRQVRREEGALLVEFDPATAEQVEQLVAAEQLCCAQIGWELTHAANLELRIRARPAQLDVVEQFLTA